MPPSLLPTLVAENLGENLHLLLGRFWSSTARRCSSEGQRDESVLSRYFLRGCGCFACSPISSTPSLSPDLAPLRSEPSPSPLCTMDGFLLDNASRKDSDVSDGDDVDLSPPHYEDRGPGTQHDYHGRNGSLDEMLCDAATKPAGGRAQIPAADDTWVETEPSRYVDYLSSEWKEEEIWSSWRYVVSRRRALNGVRRFENASWRNWAKSRFRLDTFKAGSLHWSALFSSLRSHIPPC